MSTYNTPIEVVSKRLIGDLKIFESKDEKDWEHMYSQIMDPKYKKETRNFSTTVTGKKTTNTSLYIIPRSRGGPSYKETKLVGATNEDIQYCPISKGYSMQDVSSFTLGPVVGEGLCLVNSAFSKCICIMHIEGGGKVNLKRKTYWQRSKTPDRSFKVIDAEKMIVIEKGKSEEVYIHQWLKENENLWLAEWEQWRKHIALTNVGNFHWNEDTPTVAYRYGNNYLDFVSWKKQCYIKPFYELAVKTKPYQFMNTLFKEHKISLGLVHPKSNEGEELPITKEYITELYNSKNIMCCVPYCLAGMLLDVAI
jgi:hypothetical protein